MQKLLLKNWTMFIEINVSLSALVNNEDNLLQFLLHSPVDAMLAVELSKEEYLLAFSCKFPEIFTTL